MKGHNKYMSIFKTISVLEFIFDEFLEMIAISIILVNNYTSMYKALA
jgi:hypothetical protein